MSVRSFLFILNATVTIDLYWAVGRQDLKVLCLYFHGTENSFLLPQVCPSPALCLRANNNVHQTPTLAWAHGWSFGTAEAGKPGADLWGAGVSQRHSNAEGHGHICSSDFCACSSADWMSNGNPLQCSCLESSTDRGAWQVQFMGSQNSQTRLSTWVLSYVAPFTSFFFP